MKTKKTLNFLTFILFTFILFGCIKDLKVYRNLHTAKGMFDKGVDLYVRGNYEKAIKTFRELIKKFPNSEKERAWAQYEIGYCYFHLGKKEKAIKAFRVVLDEYSIRGPRILAARMIIKFKKGQQYKRSSYED